MSKKPSWLKIPSQENNNRASVINILDKLQLNTVCSEAMCPNQTECFENKTATFMILGVNCTRNCRFCNVAHHAPEKVNPDEPKKIALATKELGLDYIVITSVTRDDLVDGGATQFSATVSALRKHCPNTGIETLIPDFKGDISTLKIVTEAKPDVMSHNVETVPNLYDKVRPEGIYKQSLDVIKNIKILNPRIHSKSSLMLGFGETKNQVLQVMDDLRNVDCDFLTLGQYLAPSKQHFPIQEYIHPDEFTAYKEIALEKGFKHVASGPFVRSSYGAGEAYFSKTS